MEVKFIYMYKIFKNYIMAIISKVSRKENDFMIENKNDQNDVLFDLNAKEIEFILQFSIVKFIIGPMGKWASKKKLPTVIKCV